MKKSHKLLPLLAALLLSFTACAGSPFAGKWYQVEVIVFSHFTKQGVTSENWNMLSQPNFDAASLMSFSSPNIEQLDDSNFSLTKEQRILLQQENYQVLMHKVWKQRVFTKKNTIPLLLSDDPSGIDGTITVSVQRFLNVNFNLYFAIPEHKLVSMVGNQYNSDIHDGYAYFHLLQSRRMRSNELNYIGHPLYGVLIKITRAEGPTDEQTQTEQQTSPQQPVQQVPQQT